MRASFSSSQSPLRARESEMEGDLERPLRLKLRGGQWGREGSLSQHRISYTAPASSQADRLASGMYIRWRNTRFLIMELSVEMQMVPTSVQSFQTGPSKVRLRLNWTVDIRRSFGHPLKEKKKIPAEILVGWG